MSKCYALERPGSAAPAVPKGGEAAGSVTTGLPPPGLGDGPLTLQPARASGGTARASESPTCLPQPAAPPSPVGLLLCFLCAQQPPVLGRASSGALSAHRALCVLTAIAGARCRLRSSSTFHLPSDAHSYEDCLSFVSGVKLFVLKALAAVIRSDVFGHLLLTRTS